MLKIVTIRHVTTEDYITHYQTVRAMMNTIVVTTQMVNVQINLVELKSTKAIKR